jgi:hypothetical protein
MTRASPLAEPAPSRRGIRATAGVSGEIRSTRGRFHAAGIFDETELAVGVDSRGKVTAIWLAPSIE